MAAIKILVPYNFSVHEWKAFDFVINILGVRKDAKITLFNTYVPVPEIDLTGNPELDKMKGGLIFLSEELKRKEQGLQSAVTYFLQHGFLEDQVDFVFKKKEKDVAEEIVDAVVGGHYDIVVLRPTPGKVSRLFARSVHEKVLRALKGVCVCIAT
jgi:hypothetical protein